MDCAVWYPGQLSRRVDGRTMITVQHNTNEEYQRRNRQGRPYYDEIKRERNERENIWASIGKKTVLSGTQANCLGGLTAVPLSQPSIT